MYWHLEGFTAIYTQFWFKWYLICHADCTGPRAFRRKTFHTGWRQFFFWNRPRIQAMYKNDHKKSMMSCTDILKGLLQSTHYSGSNGISFVMLTALVPEPFDAKLFLIGWRMKFFWNRPRIQAMHKNDHKNRNMPYVDIFNGLLQSVCNYGSNYI